MKPCELYTSCCYLLALRSDSARSLALIKVNGGMAQGP
eukprot:COSAG02_NODE_9106_length_2329_cov_1.276682_3_plen_38_part_00